MQTKSGAWTPTDDQTLRDMFANGHTATVVGQRLGRTKDAVQSRKRALGLTGLVPTAKPEPAKPATHTSLLANDQITDSVTAPKHLSEQLNGAPGRNLMNQISTESEEKVRPTLNGTTVTLTGPAAMVAHYKAALSVLFMPPTVGEVYEAEVVLTRGFGSFMKVKPFYNGILPRESYTDGQEPGYGKKYMVRVTEVSDEGRCGLELVIESSQAVASVTPKKYTVEELVDHLNGMSKIISAKIGQKVVLAAYVIAD